MTNDNDKMVSEIPIKILLVDDNDNNLMSMEVALEKEGYVFFKAASGREALRILLVGQYRDSLRAEKVVVPKG